MLLKLVPSAFSLQLSEMQTLLGGAAIRNARPRYFRLGTGSRCGTPTAPA